MIFRKSTYYILILATIFFSNTWASDIYQIKKGIFFFEEDIPENLAANKDSVGISTEHYREGESSLLWLFQPNEQIIFNAPIDVENDDDIMPKTFLAWIYNPEPSQKKLHFAFSHNDDIKLQFNASLNFSGWRNLTVPFRDMDGKAEKGINRLIITAPNKAGELYFDQMIFSIPVDNHLLTPNYITPFVNKNNKDQKTLFMFDNMLKKHYPQLDFSMNLDDTTGKTASLYRKAEQYLGINDLTFISREKIEENLQDYKKLAISNIDGIINGPPLEFIIYQKYIKIKDNLDSGIQEHLFAKKNNLQTVGKILLQTAKYLHNPNIDEKLREELTKQFLLTTRYIIDQGFARGSGHQIVMHANYQVQELFDAWFLERHLLAENKLLAPIQQSMMWFSSLGQIFESDEMITDTSIDIFNTKLQLMIKSILMLPDSQQRETFLTQFSHWLSKTINNSKGITDGFKSDGSIFHHSQHSITAAQDVFNGLVPTIYILSGSPYDINKQARQRLNDSLLKMWISTKNSNIPLVLSRQYPTGKFSINAEPFKWLALAGEIDNPNKINTQLAGIYATLTEKEDFAGVQSVAEPSGAWAMNLAGMAIQRRPSEENSNKSWLAIARGFSRYLVGNESYEANNRYSRYGRYGTLEIIPADFRKRAFSHSGWNWNHYPGTTSIYLPWEKLKSQLNQLPEAGIEEMLLSTETYLGANTLNNNAMFALKLRGHKKYQQEGFKARKSYFFFDNRIIALGSGIESTDKKNNVETTLFQHTVPTGEPIEVNGEYISQLPTHQAIKGKAVTLKDPANNYYFIPKGYDVDIYYQHQNSPDDRNDQLTENNFATAVINHGKAPKKAFYEYAIVVDGHNKTQKPNYDVLHHDNNLHAVRDVITGQEDYAYFERFMKDIGGMVLGSDVPSLVMAHKNDNQLFLSIVNPDLAFYNDIEEDQIDENGQQVEVSVYSRKWWGADSQPRTTTITLKNRWQLAENSKCATVTTNEETTTVTVTTIEATPCKIKLKNQ